MRALLVFLCLLAGVSSSIDAAINAAAVPHHKSDQQEEIVMSMVIDASKIECLYQTITNPKHQSFEIDYQVVEGGGHDITFTIKSPQGVILVNDLKRTEGTHKIRINQPQNGPGDYAFCFDNSFSYNTHKRIFFELFLLDEDGNYVNDYDLDVLRKDSHMGVDFKVEQFARITNKVRQNLIEVEKIQTMFRAMEARDRSTMEDNYDRVNFWSVFHLLGLLLVSGVQVYTLRSLFLEDSKYGQFIRSGKLKHQSLLN